MRKIARRNQTHFASFFARAFISSPEAREREREKPRKQNHFATSLNIRPFKPYPLRALCAGYMPHTYRARAIPLPIYRIFSARGFSREKRYSYIYICTFARAHIRSSRGEGYFAFIERENVISRRRTCREIRVAVMRAEERFREFR